MRWRLDKEYETGAWGLIQSACENPVQFQNEMDSYQNGTLPWGSWPIQYSLEDLMNRVNTIVDAYGGYTAVHAAADAWMNNKGHTP